jgi:transcriptional regulator with XRE-family HTH domain
MNKEFLREKRESLGLSMRNLADQIGVSKSTVSRWESGATKVISSNVLFKLAQALKISPVEVLLVMGYDNKNKHFSEARIQRIYDAYIIMDDDGKDKAVKLLEDLAEKYK